MFTRIWVWRVFRKYSSVARSRVKRDIESYLNPSLTFSLSVSLTFLSLSLFLSLSPFFSHSPYLSCSLYLALFRLLFSSLFHFIHLFACLYFHPERSLCRFLADPDLIRFFRTFEHWKSSSLIFLSISLPMFFSDSSLLSFTIPLPLFHIFPPKLQKPLSHAPSLSLSELLRLSLLLTFSSSLLSFYITLLSLLSFTFFVFHTFLPFYSCSLCGILSVHQSFFLQHFIPLSFLLSLSVSPLSSLYLLSPSSVS